MDNLWKPSTEIVTPKRWSIDFWGGGGAGKTYTLLTAPGPVFYILLDMRDPAPLILHSKRKDVFVRDLRPGGVLLTEKQVAERLDSFQKAVAQAFAQGEGTLAIDGGSVLANLLEAQALINYNKRRRAKGKDVEDRLPALERGIINATINDLLAAAGASGMNFGITHQQKEVWAETGDGKGVHPTGQFEARENSQIEYGCDMSVRLFGKWASANEKTKTPAHMEHGARITLCKINESITQQVVPNPTWNKLVYKMVGLEEEDDE